MSERMECEYYRDVLPNGLRVITVEMPHLHAVEMMCYVGVGGRHETEEWAGISHFLEHMLFRGTTEYPSSRELEQAFEGIGGAVNASTDSETTVYHARFHPDYVREAAALFASMLLRPLLQEVETERRIILEEALEDVNEKGEDVNPDNLTAGLLWPGHPLGRPTIGTRESIARIDEESLRQHRARHYSPGNAVVAVSGRVRRQDAVTAVLAAFGNWEGKNSEGSPPFLAPPPERFPASAWVRDSASQVAIQLAFRLPGRQDPASAPLRVLRRVLSSSGTSRLMLRLREELGLTYSVEANLALYADTGCFTVDLAVAPASLTTAVRELLTIFDELCTVPVGEEELARTVRTFLFDLDFSRDHTDDMAMRYGWGELVGCLRTLEQDRRDISAVTSADLREVASALFTPGNLRVAVTGPWKGKERREVEKLLRGYRK